MKKILVVGASFLQQFVIQKARSMGYYTLVVDANPNADGLKYADSYEIISVVDEKKCLEYAISQNIDGVITAASDHGVPTVAYIAENMGLPGIKYEVAKLVKNKSDVRKRLYECRADDSEPSYEVDENTDVTELAKRIGYPAMVKPCDSAGSRGVSRVDKAEDFDKACSFAMQFSAIKKITVEPFIDGREYGSEALVVNGEIHVLSLMKKLMTSAPYYAELGHAIPTDLDKETEEKAKKCVERAIKALNIDFGSVNMDMLITGDGKVHIVDVGARMGGNMIGTCIIPYGTGIDYVGAMLAGAVGDPVDLSSHGGTAVATRLFAFNGGIVKHIPDYDAISRELDVELYPHSFNVGDRINEYHTNLDGRGYVVARGDSVETAEKKAEAALKIIRSSIF